MAGRPLLVFSGVGSLDIGSRLIPA